MSGLSNYLAASKSTLIDSLDFSGNAPVADYVQERKQSTFFASGGNQYSASGVRQLRFSLNTVNGFLDMSSVSFKATVTEKGGSKSVQFLGGNLGCMITQMNIYVAGVLVEEIRYHNRVEHMLERFLPENKRKHCYDQGFGFASGSEKGSDFVSTAVAAGTSQVVVWKPLASGIMSQKCYLPSMFLGSGGLVIELLLVGDAAACCDSSTNFSTDWEITDVRCLAEVCSVDSALLTSMSKALISGTELVIPFKSYATQLYSITSSAQQLVNARALTRVDQVLVTFHNADAATKKEVNHFYLADTGQAITCQTMVGERNFPDHKSEGITEFWYRLLNGLGVNTSNQSINITRQAYKDDSFVICVDTEAVPGQASGTGLSTHGAQMTINLENLSTDAAKLPTRAYVTTWHNCILSIGQDGCVFAN